MSLHSRGGAAKRRRASLDQVQASLPKRRAAEIRFRLYGLISILMSLSFLVLLLGNILLSSLPAFRQTYIGLDINFDRDVIAPGGEVNADVIAAADYAGLVKASLVARFPDAQDRLAKRELYQLVSSSSDQDLRRLIMRDPTLIGQTKRVWLPSSDEIDLIASGVVNRAASEAERKISDRQLAWFDAFSADRQVERRFNTLFFTQGDSREPERAGIWGAVHGSFYTLLITLVLSFPIGVATAVYLEEFAPRNTWTDLIEVNINNLAAVPSIVFGLLGLAVFINFLDLPRSSSLVGGLVLSLMTLPTIIIASRSALKSVPPSIREAALGVGASEVQTVLHHVLPLALPGMLTGTIIGMARALGESAPLLMIGMVAFIVDVPESLRDPATVLPVQIYLWADSPERAFVAKTSAAILALMLFLVAMNALAVYLRRKFERRW